MQRFGGGYVHVPNTRKQCQKRTFGEKIGRDVCKSGIFSKRDYLPTDEKNWQKLRLLLWQIFFSMCTGDIG